MKNVNDVLEYLAEVAVAGFIALTILLTGAGIVVRLFGL